MTLKKFLIQLAFLVAFILLVVFLVLFWLRIYTNHGQELTLPNYLDKNYEEALKDAKDKSFEIIVNDSIHEVDKPGGLIVEQNPKAGAKVKENRKIYVTTTKYLADRKSLESLPQLFGRNYERKKKELSYMNIYTKVKGYKQDASEPDHILEVWYKGQKVIDAASKRKNVEFEVGDTLEFVLSKRSGAQLPIPDLMCKGVSEVKFLLSSSQLLLGDVTSEGDIKDIESAKIVSQHPSPIAGYTILSGEPIHVTVTQVGANCDN